MLTLHGDVVDGGKLEFIGGTNTCRQLPFGDHFLVASAEMSASSPCFEFELIEDPKPAG